LEETRDQRLAAKQLVEIIKSEELNEYGKWLEVAPMREILASYKTTLNGKVISYLEAHEKKVDEKKVKLVTDRVMRNLLKEPNLYIPDDTMNALIEEQAYF
jgi:glutamyl-tRNA reductase